MHFISFSHKFNKFNNTRARMLDSIYHMTNTLKSHFWRKSVIFLSLCTQRCFQRHMINIIYLTNMCLVCFQMNLVGKSEENMMDQRLMIMIDFVSIVLQLSCC